MNAAFHTCCSKLFAIAFAALAVTIAGCGQGPFSYVPVSGTITYDDGTPIPAASIKLIFTSQEPQPDPKIKPRPAQGGVNVADGSFSDITSMKPGDGLVPGKHKVTVFAFDENSQVSNAVPKVYSNGATTPLVIDTKDSPLKILVAKP